MWRTRVFFPRAKKITARCGNRDTAEFLLILEAGLQFNLEGIYSTVSDYGATPSRAVRPRGTRGSRSRVFKIESLSRELIFCPAAPRGFRRSPAINNASPLCSLVSRSLPYKCTPDTLSRCPRVFSPTREDTERSGVIGESNHAR